MTELINVLNNTGDGFWRFAWAMFIQSGILIVLLYLIDLLIRKRVRAVFRYCIWMLVLVKLVLPPGLCVPTGIGYWCGLEMGLMNSQETAGKSEKVTTEEIYPVVDLVDEEDTPLTPVLPEQAAGAEVSTAADESTNIATQASSKEETATVAKVNYNVTITGQGLVLLGWLVGVLVLSVLLLQRFWFVKNLLAQSEKANGRLEATLQQCCRQVGMRRDIELRLSQNMLSPAACGLLRPVILMPAALLENLSREKLRAVLIHELAHIKRGDLWVNFVQTILQIVYFYNPLLWFANAVIRGIREKAVDEMVLTKLGEEANNYSSTLIDIAEVAFSRPHFSLRLVGVVESKKALAGRIKHILSRPFPKSAKLGMAGLMVIIITAAVLLPMAKAGYNESKDKYKAVLSNGVTVELLGICELPSRGKQWWTPDGKRLGYAFKTVDHSGYTSDYPGYELVFRKSGNASFKIKSIKGSRQHSGITVIDPKGLTGYRAHIKERHKKTNIKIASPSGKWKTVLTSSGMGSFSGKIKGKTIILAAAEQAGKDIIISCSDLVGYKKATRIIAVDAKGKELTGQIQTDTGVNNLRQRTIRFANLDLSFGGEFKFQTCPYEYHTFKKVSLKPNFKTAVQVEVAKGWSEVVKGIQVRLRAEKQVSNLGEFPKFKLDLRNNGENVIHYFQDIAVGRLELNGQWYASREPQIGGGPGKILKPFEQIDNAFDIDLSTKWLRKNDKKPLNMTLGKHTVRVAFVWGENLFSKEPAIISNPVEIEVLREEDKAVSTHHPWNVQTSLPSDVMEKRNKLLAEADRKIRLGLIELADKFPQLKKAKGWNAITSSESDAGRVSISLFHTDKGKARTAQRSILEDEIFSVLIVINEPPKEPRQLSMFDMYPKIGLVGQVGTSAGNLKLDEALNSLVHEALGPLKRLDDMYLGKAKLTKDFLRPLNPNDPRETGDLEAKPLPDGRLRISPMRQWSRTHLDLSEGQRLEIHSEGSVNGCQRPVTDWAYGPWGPAGGPTEGNPDLRACALIGKIVGEAETREFFVGEKFQMNVSSDGKLYLGVSDIWHFDNSGEFVAAVKIDGKQVDFTKHLPSSPPDAPKAAVLNGGYRLKAENLPGKLVFHGRYQHRSRGRKIETPSELWIKQDHLAQLVVLTHLPWMGSCHIASGYPDHRLKTYLTERDSANGRSAYRIHLDFSKSNDKALLTRRGVRQDKYLAELTVPKAARFSPNSRPDSYSAANIFLRYLNLAPGQSRELTVCDWDNSGEKLVDYSIQISHAGKERITVPAGTFEANHLVLKQITSANTWFKKRAGHITDFWVLDNHVILRVLRHREPYEILLLDYTYPENLGGKNLK